MATNKHAIVRYQALDRCFRNIGKYYYISDLLNACNEALMSIDAKTDGIKKRQLYEDIKFMESEAGYSINLFRGNNGKDVYYRYEDPKFSINSKGLNESEAAQIKEALLILSRFKGMPQFEWVDESIAKFESSFGLKKGADKIIAFDENKDYTAIKHISPLFSAIHNEQVLKIIYKGFKQDKPIDVIFHPYFLKQFNNRWFCFGLHNDRKVLTNFALDRIIEINSHKLKYIKNKDIDFNEYFEDVIGVTVQGNVEKIVLKVNKDLWPYIESKPLHGTQKTKKIEKDFVLISIEVKPNYELESMLLSHGNKIEVLEPKSLKHSLLDRSVIFN